MKIRVPSDRPKSILRRCWCYHQQLKANAPRKRTIAFFLHVPAEHFVGRKRGMRIPACRRYALFSLAGLLYNPFLSER